MDKRIRLVQSEIRTTGRLWWLPAICCAFVVLAGAWGGARAENLSDLKAEDFYPVIESHQTGRNEITISVTLENPTNEDICFAGIGLKNRYLEYLKLPESHIYSLPQDGIDNGGYGKTKVLSQAAFDPWSWRLTTLLSPGNRTTIRFKRDFGPFANLRVPHHLGWGSFYFAAAPQGNYRFWVHNVRIFRCKKLWPTRIRIIEKKKLGYDFKGMKKITPRHPNGVYWEFKDLRGPKFKMRVSRPPPNYTLTYVDTF
ncbi:MAG: hypothetical protein GY947_11630 [Rhodobacteraceae bacterium]|nr:hypothetical protein [Paracoccaceae bacterium]